MAATHSFYLLREGVCLGKLLECTFDFPRYFGRFEATAAFEQVEPLFKTMSEELKNAHLGEYSKALEESARLYLRAQLVGEERRWPVLVRLLVSNGPATFEVDNRRLTLEEAADR